MDNLIMAFDNSKQYGHQAFETMNGHEAFETMNGHVAFGCLALFFSLEDMHHIGAGSALAVSAWPAGSACCH